MTPGKKLLVGGLVVAGVTAYMAYVGASSSWKYYLTTDECVAGGDKLVGQRMRVSGRVAPKTLQVATDRRQAQFTLAGTSGQLSAICAGTLPDNLAEEMDVVVEGRLEQDGVLRGDKILTKCASKYDARGTPPTPASISPVRRGAPESVTSERATESQRGL
jgi:cytochrome c-type biogenesis protein CcmE